MPRIRHIKPDFFLDEELAQTPPLTRLLFIGLWTHADREGRLEDRPIQIKVKVLPYEECDIEAMLKELASHWITRYTADDGRNYIQINTWQKHAWPQKTELPSRIPPPSGNGTSGRRQAIRTVPVVADKEEDAPQEDRPKTPLQDIVECFAANRGIDISNKAVCNRFFKTHCAAATELLQMSGGDMEEAKRAINDISQYFDDLVREKSIAAWSNLGAICKKFPEWKALDKSSKEVAPDGESF